jgi:hypothetical protein
MSSAKLSLVIALLFPDIRTSQVGFPSPWLQRSRSHDALSLGVKKCLSLLMDLSNMDVPKERHNGKELWVANFEILVMLESASLSFRVKYKEREFPAKRLTF